jgi:hypothetical protein
LGTILSTLRFNSIGEITSSTIPRRLAMLKTIFAATVAASAIIGVSLTSTTPAAAAEGRNAAFAAGAAAGAVGGAILARPSYGYRERRVYVDDEPECRTRRVVIREAGRKIVRTTRVCD